MDLNFLTRKLKVLRGRSIVRCTSLLFLAASIGLSCGVVSALAADSSDERLSTLEVKFFQHDYAKDSMESRLDRLEKMVFGEAKTGNPQQRLSNLLGAVPNPNPVAVDDEPS